MGLAAAARRGHGRGVVRWDWTNGERRDPVDLILEEQALPVGAVASAYGHWSTQRGAVISQGLDSQAGVVSVSLGPPEKVLAETAGAPASFGSYLATAILTTLAGLGIVWFTVWMLPTLR